MKVARVHILEEAAPSHHEPATADQSRWITTTLGEVLHLLIDAALSRRAWLRDFLDEPVALSPDLYEVLEAYRALRKASA